MAAEESSLETEEPWSYHPAYTRYWRHYHQAMAWMRYHQKAYQRAVQSYFSPLWHFPPEGPGQSPRAEESGSPPSFPGPYMAFWGARRAYSHSAGSQQRPHSGTRGEHAWAAGQETETDSDEGVECDLSNMEITEELRQYFAETERHREERRRQQQLDAKRLEDYVNADHDLDYKTDLSMDPPSERPGARRQAEMRLLYGDHAAKIQAMEAAVQLSFNKHVDRKRPKYWPVIPLKF